MDTVSFGGASGVRARCVLNSWNMEILSMNGTDSRTSENPARCDLCQTGKVTYISLLERFSPLKFLAEIYVTHLWSPGRMCRDCLTRGVRVPLCLAQTEITIVTEL